jgi:predicted ribosome quality control (RQC) complex YloA/Tae2 family protein
MHFDALALACVAYELAETLMGGRVQQVLLPDAHSVGLEIYAQRQRRYLFASAQPNAGRIHLVSQKLRRGVEQETPLLLLLRKYVRESILDAVVQPDPMERILHLHFDHPGYGETKLIIEPMGRLSNILLVNANGNILDCVNRVRPGEHAQRVLMPGRPYLPPPPQDRLSPVDDGGEAYYEELAGLLQGPGKLWKVIAEGVAGASPTVGREVAFRVMGDVEAQAGDDVPMIAVTQCLQELWGCVESGEWSPGSWLENGKCVGYSAYPITFRPGFTPVEGISVALEAYYAAQAGSAEGEGQRADAYAGLRRQAAAQLMRARRRVERQLAAASGDAPDAAAAAQLRREAEWLLALQSQLTPGQKLLEVDLGEGEPLRIALDPALSPVEQAQRKFKRAGKMVRAAHFVPERRAQLMADLAFLDQLATDLTLAENQPQIATVVSELQSSGLLPQRPGRSKVTRPAQEVLRLYSVQGTEIMVGRNARQNDHITFALANASDLWLHARDVPGAHVVIRSGGQAVDGETLQAAAQLAAYYSQRRGDGAVPVIVTPRRFVTRVPGGRPGQVHFRQEETIVVPATMPAEIMRK